MSEFRIENLKPARVVACRGDGPEPERVAWSRMRRYVRRNRLDEDGEWHRFFGFNDPQPKPGSPEHGYEQWMTVADGAVDEEGVALKQFPGGTYAVAHCHLADIQGTWQELVEWAKRKGYPLAEGPLLEECLTPPIQRSIREDLEFELYLPVRMPQA
jgi:DNA gyrase inhibitor GyrI